jgi:hypothetical protein
MPKEPREQKASKGGLECEVSAEGFYVFVEFEDQKTRKTASLKLHRHAAASLHALLAGSEGDESPTCAVILRGELTTGEEHV